MSTKAHSRIVSLDPGLYIISYEAPDYPRQPRVVLGEAPEDNAGTLRLAGPQLHGQTCLSHPGEAAAAYIAEAPVPLSVTSYVPEGFPLTRYRLSIRPAMEPAAGVKMAPTRPISLVSLEGHVEDRGDIEAEAGAWLGDPGGRKRVEGFRITWPGRPMGVDLRASCSVAGYGRIVDVLTGGFVGTRRRAAPITAIGLELVGEKAGNYSLSAEAAFAERGKVTVRPGEEITGIGSRDFLTALKVMVRPAGP